jgi:hypothetical protein
MRKLETGEIALTAGEAESLRAFIRNKLDRSWDRYTDLYMMPGMSWEEGMRKMNPALYDIAEQLTQLGNVDPSQELG